MWLGGSVCACVRRCMLIFVTREPCEIYIWHNTRKMMQIAMDCVNEIRESNIYERIRTHSGVNRCRTVHKHARTHAKRMRVSGRRAQTLVLLHTNACAHAGLSSQTTTLIHVYIVYISMLFTYIAVHSHVFNIDGTHIHTHTSNGRCIYVIYTYTHICTSHTHSKRGIPFSFSILAWYIVYTKLLAHTRSYARTHIQRHRYVHTLSIVYYYSNNNKNEYIIILNARNDEDNDDLRECLNFGTSENSSPKSSSTKYRFYDFIFLLVCFFFFTFSFQHSTFVLLISYFCNEIMLFSKCLCHYYNYYCCCGCCWHCCWCIKCLHSFH